MPRLRRITVQCRFHNGSWALFFNGLPLSTSESGRKFISLHLHKKREQTATAQSVVEIVRGELARGVAYEDLGLFKNSSNGHAQPVYTVAEMIGDYFKDRELHGVLEKTTLRQRKRSFGQWVTPSPENALKYGPGIGARDARGVTDADIIALVSNIRSRRNRLGRPNSKGYAALVVREVSAVFAWARLKDSEGRRLPNPCHGLGEYVRDRKVKRVEGERVKMRPFTHDDEATFLSKARELYGYEEWFFWLTLLRTGVRIGEGLALELADYKVDEAKPHLHVHQTWSGDDVNPQRKNVEDVNVHLRIWPSYLDEARRFIRHRHQQNQQREQLMRWAFATSMGNPGPTRRCTGTSGRSCGRRSYPITRRTIRGTRSR
jgi:integrase